MKEKETSANHKISVAVSILQVTVGSSVVVCLRAHCSSLAFVYVKIKDEKSL